MIVVVLYQNLQIKVQNFISMREYRVDELGKNICGSQICFVYLQQNLINSRKVFNLRYEASEVSDHLSLTYTFP